MLLKATKFFLFLTLFYLIFGIISFIIALPETLLAIKALLEYLPLCVTTFLIYLVLKDIDTRIFVNYNYLYKTTTDLKEQVKKQETQIKALLKTTEDIKKELKELKEQLKNNEN